MLLGLITLTPLKPATHSKNIVKRHQNVNNYVQQYHTLWSSWGRKTLLLATTILVKMPFGELNARRPCVSGGGDAYGVSCAIARINRYLIDSSFAAADVQSFFDFI
jgi:hypothetical protein